MPSTSPAVAKDWVDNTYRPAKETGAHPSWPAAPPIGSDGATCATFVDDTYRPFYAGVDHSGGNGPPPPPPVGN